MRCSTARFTIASDVGTMGLSDAGGARACAQYLLKGGFLWVDDFWGTPAWEQWSGEIHKALPEFPIVDIPPDHAIRHEMFNIKRRDAGDEHSELAAHAANTQERGDDSPHADFRMIADEKGRIMVVMTHNTDIGDSWEREGEDHEFFLQFSPAGYSLGMNVLLYAMTH